MDSNPVEVIVELDQVIGAKQASVNKQEFKNSPLSASSVEVVSKAEEAAGETLYGQRDPNLAILHEKAEHRLVLILTLKGYSNREIAKFIGYSEPWVSQIKRQPWFKKKLNEELKSAQEEVVEQIIRREGVNSIFTLVELRDTAESEQVRAAAAKDILDRLMGKPVQKQEVSGSIGVQHTAQRVENINEQLEEIERQEKLLTGAK